MIFFKSKNLQTNFINKFLSFQKTEGRRIVKNFSQRTALRGQHRSVVRSIAILLFGSSKSTRSSTGVCRSICDHLVVLRRRRKRQTPAKLPKRAVHPVLTIWFHISLKRTIKNSVGWEQPRCVVVQRDKGKTANAMCTFLDENVCSWSKKRLPVAANCDLFAFKCPTFLLSSIQPERIEEWWDLIPILIQSNLLFESCYKTVFLILLMQDLKIMATVFWLSSKK